MLCHIFTLKTSIFSNICRQFSYWNELKLSVSLSSATFNKKHNVCCCFFFYHRMRKRPLAMHPIAPCVAQLYWGYRPTFLWKINLYLSTVCSDNRETLSTFAHTTAVDSVLLTRENHFIIKWTWIKNILNVWLKFFPPNCHPLHIFKINL